MARKVDNLRMTMVDAMERFPNEYILMCMNGREDSPITGEVLFVGDKEKELWSEFDGLEEQNYCGVFGGINLMPMFGGIIADGTS
ncbi:MAG: hypothetical protein FWF82_00530 [Oscillospiraceae bacterium]|nr:hypothetical protein [Oscillospiraceae bacterium]